MNFKDVTRLVANGKEVIKISNWAGKVLWEAPQPYQQLKYVYTTSAGPYFDLGVTVDGNSIWTVHYGFYDNSDNQSQIGADYFLWVVTTESLTVYNGSSYSRSSSGTWFWSTSNWEFKINQATGQAWGSFSRTFSGIRNAGYTARDQTLYIGGRHTGSGGTSYLHPFYFYDENLVNGSGVTISDVIAVKLLRDITQDGKTYKKDTVGLWDKITNKFLPNKGTGTVRGGPAL